MSIGELISLSGDDMVFPDHQAFEVACKVLIGKYEDRSKMDEMGSWRTNSGWIWKEHRASL